MTLVVLLLAALHAQSYLASGESQKHQQPWREQAWRDALRQQHQSSAHSKLGRRLLSAEAPEALPDGPACPPLSKDVFKNAKNNTVLITFIDHHHFKHFMRSWWDSVQTAGITYAYVAAMDPWSSAALGAMGVTQCFNSPIAAPSGKGFETSWYDDRWKALSWLKVKVIKAVYDLGFSVMYTDADATWWREPLPWLQTMQSQWGLDMIFSIDEHATSNEAGDLGPEKDTHPGRHINAGTLFIAQSQKGREFLNKWVALEPKIPGSDQDGLTAMVKGSHFRSDMGFPDPTFDKDKRVIYAAQMKEMRVGFAPVHLFSNAYTYTVGRVHEKLQTTPFVTHWVWTGRTPECKVQHTREAMMYSDAPQWYGVAAPKAADSPLYEYTANPPISDTQPLMLLSMDLGSELPLPSGFNEWGNDRTEDMIEFHLASVRSQLNQVYWGLLASAGLGRTFILPDFKCYCIKTLWPTTACRISHERHTNFPYHCLMSDLFKTQKVMTEGIQIPQDATNKVTIHVRDRLFLSHPQVPKEIKGSGLVVRPAPDRMLPADSVPSPDSLKGLQPVTLSDGSMALDVPWPLTAEELKQVVGAAAGGPYRVVHLTNATQVVGRGFQDPHFWATFDTNINKYTTYWCCRSEDDQKKYQKPAREVFHITPPERTNKESTA